MHRHDSGIITTDTLIYVCSGKIIVYNDLPNLGHVTLRMEHSQHTLYISKRSHANIVHSSHLKHVTN